MRHDVSMSIKVAGGNIIIFQWSLRKEVFAQGSYASGLKVHRMPVPCIRLIFHLVPQIFVL